VVEIYSILVRFCNQCSKLKLSLNSARHIRLDRHYIQVGRLQPPIYFGDTQTPPQVAGTTPGKPFFPWHDQDGSRPDPIADALGYMLDVLEHAICATFWPHHASYSFTYYLQQVFSCHGLCCSNGGFLVFDCWVFHFF
jgi:hypothetical protein